MNDRIGPVYHTHYTLLLYAVSIYDETRVSQSNYC